MSKIIVGMSGGVDSSVAAYLLKKQGHEVIGLFMRNWDSLTNNDILGNKNSNQEQCLSETDYLDALEVCKKLGIKLHRVDFVKEYWDYVFVHFIKEYKQGRTPNPDILCNKYIKFDQFLNYAIKEFKADYIAMGHYAKTENGHLFRAKDQTKDQTYFLSQLSNKQLQKTLFPLAEYHKSEIRKIATEQGLITANKKDSTGICFIGERKFTEFLQNYIPNQPGNIVDIVTNKVVGQHIGVMYYTIGQRKGLNLGGMNEPYYVAGHDVAKKIIYVAPFSRQEYLNSDAFSAIDLNLNSTDFNINNISAKFRYRQKDIPVFVKFIATTAFVSYPQKFKAVTPGQQVVFYDGQKCLGGATIDKIYHNDKLITYL